MTDHHLPPETVEMTLPRWMVKWLRGSARHEKHTAVTPEGEADAERIEQMLTYYLEIDDE